MRRLALVIGLVLLAVFPAFGQAAAWSVYLYNGMTKELLRVNEDGSTESFNLGLAENEYIGSFDMAFSSDGGRVAFCIPVFDGQSNQGRATLVVRDITAETDIVRQDLGEAIGCRVGREGYNDDASRLAVSLANPFPPDTGKPLWRILLLDAATGTTVDELNPTYPALAEYPLLTQGPVLPFVQRFTADDLIFAEVPYGIGGGAEWQAYRWSFDSGAVEPVEGWGNIGLAWLPTTGEIAYVAADDALPAAQPVGPFPPFNVVRLHDADGGPRTIYHNGDESPAGTVFINDGRELAILLMEGYDAAQPDQATLQRWVALNRDGSRRDLTENSIYVQLMGAPGGYVTLTQQLNDQTMGTQQFTLGYGAEGNTRELWTSPQGTDQSWELAWVTPGTPAADLPPFPSAGQ
ncbi:MAG: hypothetical protein HZC41_09205 [Chloroflexi bacterium]|nr:hypothetical protein [Chloroflexota bacterium]